MFASMAGRSPQIVQYQGSKRILAPQILGYMPHHFDRLIEPFAGMAAISVAVARAKRADCFLINDINSPIVAILKSAIETPSQLLAEYTSVWEEQFSFSEGSVAHFYRVRDLFNAGAKTAANMLYLLARCVKGAVRYSNSGDFNQSPDKRRNGTSPKTLKANIDAISYYLKGKTSFLSSDYHDALALAQKGDLVYMDPPYQGVSDMRDSRYIAGVNYDDFVEAIEDLNRRNVDFLVSYDGVCGDKKYGRDLPKELNLRKVMLNAGASTTSVLLGNKKTTYEALYVSRGLWNCMPVQQERLSLFEPPLAV